MCICLWNLDQQSCFSLKLADQRPGQLDTGAVKCKKKKMADQCLPLAIRKLSAEICSFFVPFVETSILS